MRLTTEQIKVIKQTVAEVFGDDAEVRLFGSRLNDQIGGGDIDLLISLPHVCEDRLGKELRLTARLQLRLGDQPFDVLVVDPEVTLNPVNAHAIETRSLSLSRGSPFAFLATRRPSPPPRSRGSPAESSSAGTCPSNSFVARARGGGGRAWGVPSRPRA